MEPLTHKIITHLENANIPYQLIDHLPTSTCEQSAAERGTDLLSGGKSILLKDKTGFRLFVISAAKSIDLKKVRRILSSQKLRLATEEELFRIAGVQKGAMPPIGRPLFPLDLYVDQSIVDNSVIAFNAGSLTKSLIISVDDYLKFSEPKRCEFSVS